MLFAVLDGLQLVILGLLILVVAFVLRRSATLQKQSRRGHPTTGHRDESQNAEQTARDWVQGMELRLYDFGREVEGRIETRIARLDTLIAEADREIQRLASLLRESSGREVSVSDFDLSESMVQQIGGRRQRLMIARLHDAGFELQEIARIVNASIETVRSVLNEDSSQDRDAA